MKETYYIVDVPEIHYARTRVLASSPEDAVQKVCDGNGDVVSTEYSHTSDHIPTENWVVEEVS